MLEQEQTQETLLDETLKSELRNFEDFLKRIGFKRIHGSIYGLLVMSERPLSSAEIEKELSLSQSAVSQGIKTLAMYGAVHSYDDRQRNCLVHSATLNTLDIVASVFKKREMETISNYKGMAIRLKDYFINRGHDPESPQIKRIESIITTSTLGETVIEFILKLADLQLNEKLNKITEKLPNVLKVMTTTVPTKKEVFNQMNNIFSDKVMNRFK